MTESSIFESSGVVRKEAEESFHTPATRQAVAAIVSGNLKSVFLDTKSERRWSFVDEPDQLKDAEKILLLQRKAIQKITDFLRTKEDGKPLPMREYIKIIIDNAENIPEEIRDILAGVLPNKAFISAGGFNKIPEANQEYLLSLADCIRMHNLLNDYDYRYQEVIKAYDEILRAEDRAQAVSMMLGQEALAEKFAQPYEESEQAKAA